MSSITNNYAEGSCVFEAGSSQNGDVTISGNIYQGGARKDENPAASSGQASSAGTPSAASPLHLNQNRGYKIDLIRVLNTLYELGFFTDARGGRISKKEVFTTLGHVMNLDLSSYDKDLSRSLSDSTALEKHLRIFDQMKEKMEDVFNAYGG